MLKAYKYRLNPTSEQISLMEKTFGSTRFIYNWALRMKIEACQDDKKSLTAIDLCKKLTDLKKQEEYTWLNEVSSECLQQSIRNLDQAFTKFFKSQMIHFGGIGFLVDLKVYSNQLTLIGYLFNKF